jgi:hypothetical protein
VEGRTSGRMSLSRSCTAQGLSRFSLLVVAPHGALHPACASGGTVEIPYSVPINVYQTKLFWCSNSDTRLYPPWKRRGA